MTSFPLNGSSWCIRLFNRTCDASCVSWRIEYERKGKLGMRSKDDFNCESKPEKRKKKGTPEKSRKIKKLLHTKKNGDFVNLKWRQNYRFFIIIHITPQQTHSTAPLRNGTDGKRRKVFVTASALARMREMCARIRGHSGSTVPTSCDRLQQADWHYSGAQCIFDCKGASKKEKKNKTNKLPLCVFDVWSLFSGDLTSGPCTTPQIATMDTHAPYIGTTCAVTNGPTKARILWSSGVTESTQARLDSRTA